MTNIFSQGQANRAFKTVPTAAASSGYFLDYVNPYADGGSSAYQQVQFDIGQRLHNIAAAVEAAKEPEKVINSYSETINKLLTQSKTSQYLFNDMQTDIDFAFPLMTDPQKQMLHQNLAKSMFDSMANMVLHANQPAMKILRDIGVDVGVPQAASGGGGAPAPRVSMKKKRSSRRSRSSRK